MTVSYEELKKKFEEQCKAIGGYIVEGDNKYMCIVETDTEMLIKSVLYKEGQELKIKKILNK